jgi:hypothetical protein
MLRYEVQRSVLPAGFVFRSDVALASSPVIFDDSLTQWGWTVSYQVRAVDGNLNASPFVTLSVPITIPSLVPKLAVRNGANHKFDVRLVRVSDGKYSDLSGGEVPSTWSTQIPNAGSTEWTNLRPELYRIEYKRTNTTWIDKTSVDANLVNGDLSVDIL